MPHGILRLISHLWPLRLWNGQGAHGMLELRLENGELVINSANANQSHGSLHRVWRRALADAGPAVRDARSVLILGYGAGSLECILRSEMGLDPMIVAVDDDPLMFQLARERFGLAVSPRTSVHVADAFTFMERDAGGHDLVLLDLFNDLDVVPEVASPRSVASLRDLTRPGGMVMVNTVVHDDRTAAISARLADGLRLHFSEVRENRYEGTNRVFIAL